MVEWSGTFADHAPGEPFDPHVPGSAGDFAPDIDLDGDGLVETAVLHEEWANGHERMTVLSDLDGDGAVDRVTEFADDGRFVAWVSTADVGWSEVERGSL